jgi:hypothetical protein
MKNIKNLIEEHKKLTNLMYDNMMLMANLISPDVVLKPDDSLLPVPGALPLQERHVADYMQKARERLHTAIEGFAWNRLYRTDHGNQHLRVDSVTYDYIFETFNSRPPERNAGITELHLQVPRGLIKIYPVLVDGFTLTDIMKYAPAAE